MRARVARAVESRLTESLRAQKPPGEKKPLNMPVAAEATKDMAGVLGKRICTAERIIKFPGSVLRCREAIAWTDLETAQQAHCLEISHVQGLGPELTERA